MSEHILNDEQYNFVLDCLNCLKECFVMINKLPIKKSKKIKGQSIISSLDDFIVKYKKL